MVLRKFRTPETPKLSHNSAPEVDKLDPWPRNPIVCSLKRLETPLANLEGRSRRVPWPLSAVRVGVQGVNMCAQDHMAHDVPGVHIYLPGPRTTNEKPVSTKT